MKERQTQKYLEKGNGIGDQEDKERCGCRPMPPGGEKMKKKMDHWFIKGILKDTGSQQST
jgi:hypothetical protein